MQIACWEWLSNGCLQYVSHYKLFSQKHHTIQNKSLNISLCLFVYGCGWMWGGFGLTPVLFGRLVKFSNLYFVKAKVHVFTVIHHRWCCQNTRTACDWFKVTCNTGHSVPNSSVLMTLFQLKASRLPHQCMLYAGIATRNFKF